MSYDPSIPQYDFNYSPCNCKHEPLTFRCLHEQCGFVCYTLNELQEHKLARHSYTSLALNSNGEHK